MAQVRMICHCGSPYTARQADLDRGWGLSCDKHCAAIRRDFGKPPAKRVDGLPIRQGKKKKVRRYTPDARLVESDKWQIHKNALDSMEDGWDGHKNAF